MNKKFFISLGIILCIVFSYSVCFAADNGLSGAADNVRNFVGGVENTVENAARGISNASKDATGSLENGMSGNNNNNNRTMNNSKDMYSSSSTNSGYTVTRTATGNPTIMGMTQTGWTWLIMAIAAVAIIAVVWYYSMQFTNNNGNTDDMD